MLVSFSVSNYRSFGEEVTLNMVASSRLDDHPSHLTELDRKHSLLRSAVVYGANAAGKSNLTRAMKFAQSVVRSGELMPYEPFMLDSRFANEPSSFEFRFVVNDRIFAYGFDLKPTGIQSEWLSLVRSDDDQVIFTRSASGETTVESSVLKQFPDSQVLARTLNILRSLPLKPDQLFLNRASSLPEVSQGPTLRSVLNWLFSDLVVLGPNHRAPDLLDRLHSDRHFREFSRQFLAHVGTGIAGLHIVEGKRPAHAWERKYFTEVAPGKFVKSPFGRDDASSDSRLDPNDPTSVIVRTLFATHKSSEAAYLPFGEESDGTQQLLHLMHVICPSLTGHKVVVIDELDRSLHPLICWEFIRFFGDSPQCAGNQLIVTTHEAHLLDHDLLRRDEYWFVEKDKSQQSRLVSLNDFNVRKDLQLQKGYLNGRFGAIPMIGGTQAIERLLKCGGGKEGDDATQETSS